MTYYKVHCMHTLSLYKFIDFLAHVVDMLGTTSLEALGKEL